MKRLLHLFFFSLLLCSCNQEKRADDIYSKLKEKVTLTDSTEMKNKLSGVVGCYNLTLGAMNQKTVLDTLTRSGFKKDYLFDSSPYGFSYDGIERSDFKFNNLTFNNYELETSYLHKKELTAVFLKDTLIQIILNHEAASLLILEEKYGIGDRWFHDSAFGIDKNGKKNLRDFCSGYDRRTWYNDIIRIDYDHLPFLTHNLGLSYVCTYTYIPAIPELDKELQDSYNFTLQKRDAREEKEKSNL